MDSVFAGFVLDPVKCRELSLSEKRELVYEISQWSKNAPEILSSFTRRELLEIICAEMGKERKYTGFTKSQMIDHLLKLVAEKAKKCKDETAPAVSPADAQTASKRKRPKEPSSQKSSEVNNVPDKKTKEQHAKVRFCENVACQARLDASQVFCSRCSCCICHHFDDNKDPSLWLTCGSDSLDEKAYCGLSCHLNCALEDKRTLLMNVGNNAKLDGSYCCVYCGKINGIMRCWRKQLVTAKSTRRVDALCLRISLGHKILVGTARYSVVQEIVETALNLLEEEVGPLNLLCTKIARGIVSRLSCGAEVQRLCASAIEIYDSMLLEHPFMEKNNFPGLRIHFEEPSPTSVIIVLEYTDAEALSDCLGCKIWHRKSSAADYLDRPIFAVFGSQKRFQINELEPSTEYAFRVSLFNNEGSLGVREATCVTPSADKHTANNTRRSPKAKPQVSDGFSKGSNGDSKSAPFPVKTDSLTSRNSISPPTPNKSIGTAAVQQAGAAKNVRDENEYEYCVSVVKQLEQDGHIEGDFRVKFLTWFSLKATAQERRVVSVFVQTFSDDPQSLAGQLLHTFMDEIAGAQKLIPCQEACAQRASH